MREKTPRRRARRTRVSVASPDALCFVAARSLSPSRAPMVTPVGSRYEDRHVRFAWLAIVTFLACSPPPAKNCELTRPLLGAVVAGAPFVVEFSGACKAWEVRNSLRLDETTAPSIVGQSSVSFTDLPTGLFELTYDGKATASFLVYQELSNPSLVVPARCWTFGFLDGGVACGDRRYSPDAGFGPREVPDGGYEALGGHSIEESIGHFERCGRPFLRVFTNTPADSGITKGAACSGSGVLAIGSSTQLERFALDGGTRIEDLPFPTTTLSMRFVDEQLLIIGGRYDAPFGNYWCTSSSAMSDLTCENYSLAAYPQASIGLDVLSSTGTAFGANTNFLGRNVAALRELSPLMGSSGLCGNFGVGLMNGIGFRIEGDDFELCILVDETGAYGVRRPQRDAFKAGGFEGPYLWASDKDTTSTYRLPGR